MGLLYDPPSGWRYGFPREYKPLPGESLADTLLRDGYPQHEIDNGGAKYCRFTGEREELEVMARRHAEGGNDNAPVAARVQPARMEDDPVYHEFERLANGQGFNHAAPSSAAPWHARRGDWMQTASGRQFWPMDPRPEDIHIEDIAHSLSMQCRFAGHCLRFYSVAEHSVHLARYFAGNTELALWALLHDASEAYLVDVPRPVKPFLPGYREAEAAVMGAVTRRFALPRDMPPEVHEADTRILGDERANMAPCVAEWGATGEPLGVELKYWSPEEAEDEFLFEFVKLMEARRMAA